jgi:hypothetical protein
MSPRSSTAAAHAAPPPTTIAALPHAVLARVFACLPIDARLRASEVCRGWRHVVTTERSLWTALDLSDTSGVTHEVTDALLHAAAAKAGSALRSLDVSRYDWLSYDALLAVVTANAALRELRAEQTFPADGVTCVQAEALICAAPQLRELFSDVDCDAEDAARVLRSEGAFQALRICELCVFAENAGRAELHALAAALAAHVRPLPRLWLNYVQLDAADVLDAMVDGVLANRVPDISFENCSLSPASMPALVRLLGSGALSLLILGDVVQLLDAPAAGLLGDALRRSDVLQSLTLSQVRLWDHTAAATTVLSSLVAHPSLRELDLSMNMMLDPQHAACVGAALFALVAANAPTLTQLDMSNCHLGDVGLRPLFDALPRNTHLHTLNCGGNGMSEAFARDVLLPAVRANTSLTELVTAVRGDPVWDGKQEAEAIVTRRAAEAS